MHSSWYSHTFWTWDCAQGLLNNEIYFHLWHQLRWKKSVAKFYWVFIPHWNEYLCWNAITQSEGVTGYWCIYVSGWKKTRRPNTSVYCSLLQSGALKTQNIRPRGTRMELCETNPGSSHSGGWIYQMHIEPALPSVMDCIYFFPTGPLAGSSLGICSRRISRGDPALTLGWWASTALASLDVKWWERVQRVWTAKSAALQVEFMYDKLAELVPRTRAKHISSKKWGNRMNWTAATKAARPPEPPETFKSHSEQRSKQQLSECLSFTLHYWRQIWCTKPTAWIAQMDMQEATNSLLNRFCCNCGPLDLSCLGEKNALASQIFLSHFAPRPQKQFVETEETQRGLQAKAALPRPPTGLCDGV